MRSVRQLSASMSEKLKTNEMKSIEKAVISGVYSAKH